MLAVVAGDNEIIESQDFPQFRNRHCAFPGGPAACGCARILAMTAGCGQRDGDRAGGGGSRLRALTILSSQQEA